MPRRAACASRSSTNRARPPLPASLGAAGGAALYVGSLIGPGVLLVPALAVRAAGPASVVGWGALLLLSVPLAATFATLGVRMPGAGGVARYVRAGFGPTAGFVTGGWFLTAVLVGAPAVSMIGGLYVADVTGSGTAIAALVALAMFLLVLGTNAFGLRASARLQFASALVLTVLIAVAIGAAVPETRAIHWTPFAPHGWWAIGTASSILVWLFVGWESVAQLTDQFRDPGQQLPHAVASAFCVVAVLYCGLAVVTVGIGIPSHSTVPLADLMAAGFGEAGRRATAILAVALTMATMNVYVASAARLASALAREGALPSWLASDDELTVPRRPLVVIGVTGALLLLCLVLGLTGTSALVRATSACFVAVYVGAMASAVRILRGRIRVLALPALAFVAVIAAFSSWYLLLPLGSAAGFAALARAPVRHRPARSPAPTTRRIR